VLFIDLFQAIDGGCPDEVLEIKKAEIPGIQSILHARTKSCYPPVRNFAFAAMRVIENLNEAEKAKRLSAKSRRDSITATTEEKAEPVGSVFQVGLLRRESCMQADPDRMYSESQKP
jgi:hypothetical protein